MEYAVLRPLGLCLFALMLFLFCKQTPALVKKKPKTDIPVPQINTVDSYVKDLPAVYDIKRSYVRYHRETDREWKEALDYVVDHEDESWLKQNSKFGGAVSSPQHAAATTETKEKEGSAATLAPAGETESKAEKKDDAKHEAGKINVLKQRPQLSLESLEVMLDILEKATAFDAIVTLHQAESLILSKMPELLHLFPLKGRGVIKFKQVLNDVYSYWVSKRSKLKRPLLRRFWPVTSCDDTNPHLVFRPREKEKYKLRKKRQNDLEAFRKMKQLRNDFDSLRAVLDLVKRREELNRTHVQLQIDMFRQRLHDIVDTSGTPRNSGDLRKDEVKRQFDIPVYFDVQPGTRKVKRIRLSGVDEQRPPSSTHTTTAAVDSRVVASSSISSTNTSRPNNEALKRIPPRNIAGRNHGEPAPNFLQPLQTRESYVTSWDTAVPDVTSYSDSHATSTFRFRHRPRVGRGGRVCIDRLPQPEPHPAIQPQTILRAGLPPASTEKPQHLLDLLPRPLDRTKLRRRIEELSVAAIAEDVEAQAMAAAPGLDPEDNDGDEVIVRVDDWLSTDEQLWGEERSMLGPI